MCGSDVWGTDGTVNDVLSYGSILGFGTRAGHDRLLLSAM